MENEDRRPKVWVARRLMRRGCNCGSHPIAYFISSARVQNVTKRFLKNGKEVKEYEVEYETPVELEDLCYEGGYDVFAETGDFVKVDRVFRDYITASNYIDLLNMKLEASSAGCVPKSMVEETIASSRKEQHFARSLEKYFDGVFIGDSREF